MSEIEPWSVERVQPHRLVQAREFLKDSITQPACLEDVAARSCLSKFHFARVFARTYGVSPMTYRMALRIDEAKRRLCAGAPIKVVAFDLGFNDVSHFGRVFKKHAGMPPGAFKKKARYAERVVAVSEREPNNALNHQTPPLRTAMAAKTSSPRA